jgi:F-type H+-transporting ATPase subunit gamma
MRRANLILDESSQIATIKDLTSVFEGLASSQVAKVKTKTTLAQEFFNLLWERYSSIRIDPRRQITNRAVINENDRKVFIIISAEAGLSGDIDRRLIETMLLDYDPKNTDIIVLGSHGAAQLNERKIPFVRFFQVPETDSYIDVSPVIEAVIPYSRAFVYYEEYVSLGVQEIKSIDLITSIKMMSEETDKHIITAENTIFEPSLDDIADQMEVMMMTLALSQTILESSLAQSASRFNAMAVAKKQAILLLSDYFTEYHRAKRYESDKRLREVMITLKKKSRAAGEMR